MLKLFWFEIQIELPTFISIIDVDFSGFFYLLRTLRTNIYVNFPDLSIIAWSVWLGVGGFLDALEPVLMALLKKVRLLEYNVIWSNEIKKKTMISQFLVSARILFF